MSLSEKLGPGRLISLIGGGGKTSLMFELAREACGTGRSVITTTTTKIRVPKPAISSTLLLGSDPSQSIEEVKKLLQERQHITVGREIQQERKLIGISPESADELKASCSAELLLVEADGSAGRSLKAHAPHEPVIPVSSDLVVVLIGIDCIGAELDDRSVHRAELFSQRLGRPMGCRISDDDVAAIVHHPEGYLACVTDAVRVVVVLNKVSRQGEAEARKLARVLVETDATGRIDRVLAGSIRARTPWLDILEG